VKDSEGELAVKIARRAVEAETRGDREGRIDAPGSFQEKRGVFVTLNTFPDLELRGCIGFPEPIFSLASALLQAAQHACHDPRFPDLRPEELDGIVVEVTVLTPPEEVRVRDRRDLLNEIVIGRDGLIMEYGPYRGLLLPQVPVEWGWSTEEFLAHACNKAGLPPKMWMDDRTMVYRFEGEIFHETSPRGKVQRKEIAHGTGN
jgi:uncharacterized protein (TIGR00296 family)